MNKEEYLIKPQSKLEELIYNIGRDYFDKRVMKDDIDTFERSISKIFDAYQTRIKSIENPEVILEVKNIKQKIMEIIKEMNEVIRLFDDEDIIKTLVINKCLKMSSDLELERYNIAGDFSNLKGEIEKHYDKREKRMKCVAVGSASALALAGIGTGAYAIVDYKADQIKEVLVELYNSEENIPNHVNNEFFTEIGVPKNGATEKLKKIILSKSLKNIINKELKGTIGEGLLESLSLDYGKDEYHEQTGRGARLTKTDGYSIVYNVRGEEKEYIGRQDVYEGIQKDELLDHTVKDKDAQKVRKWLSNLSIEDCMNILKGECEEREKFEEYFENTILEINNRSLKKVVDNLKEDNKEDNNEIEL